MTRTRGPPGGWHSAAAQYTYTPYGYSEGMGALVIIGGSLREAFFMFWETLWALVLGFGLSGAVQAFVSRSQMQRVMGSRGPAALTRSSLLGMASSSCSFAASALAKSLFQRGADFTAAMVFMFASTNLVAELGIVLWLLIGWQFTLAEFVGGAIMIVLLGVLVPRLVPRRLVTAARERLDRDAADRGGPAEDVGPAGDSLAGQGDSLAWRLRQRSRWADAAGYTISDLTMLRREIVIGFVAAGQLTLRLLGVFWLVMSVAGLLTELIANAAGVIPQTRPTSIAPEHLSWNYTTILNIVFLLVLAALYWLHRSQERFGGGRDVARDPVCGMQVDKLHPGAVLRADGHTTYFCSEHCRDHYSRPDPTPTAGVSADPGRGLAAARAREGHHDA